MAEETEGIEKEDIPLEKRVLQTIGRATVYSGTMPGLLRHLHALRAGTTGRLATFPDIVGLIANGIESPEYSFDGMLTGTQHLLGPKFDASGRPTGDWRYIIANGKAGLPLDRIADFIDVQYPNSDADEFDRAGYMLNVSLTDFKNVMHGQHQYPVFPASDYMKQIKDPMFFQRHPDHAVIFAAKAQDGSNGLFDSVSDFGTYVTAVLGGHGIHDLREAGLRHPLNIDQAFPAGYDMHSTGLVLLRYANNLLGNYRSRDYYGIYDKVDFSSNRTEQALWLPENLRVS